MKEPKVINYFENEWEFVYPEGVENENVQNEYWNAVELLDYDDASAEKTFKRLIKKFPYFIDAYNHLSIAFENQGKKFESYLTAEKSHGIAKSFLPKEFKIGKDKLTWSHLSNRPFLRSYQIYGLECQANKNYSKAIELYKSILSFNEGDNQGARYLYLECLFLSKKYDEAKNLLESYSEDWSIEFLYGKVALDVLSNNLKIAEESLSKANQVNSHLSLELKKEKFLKPPPFRISGEPFLDVGSPVGTIQEAYDYWNRNKQLYRLKKIKEFYLNL
ncbi:MAG: tetratricopeptide repeat protein [Bacteroidota bacterium]